MFVLFVVMFMILAKGIRIMVCPGALPLRIYRMTGFVRSVALKKRILNHRRTEIGSPDFKAGYF
jgi:hypothetical protein